MGACPYLGIKDDSTIMLSMPSRMHRCHAEQPLRSPELDYQTRCCLTSEHESCPIYKSAGLKRAQQRAASSVPVRQIPMRRGLLLFGVLLLAGGLIAAAVYASGIAPVPDIATLLGNGAVAAESTPLPATSTPMLVAMNDGTTPDTSGDRGEIALASGAGTPLAASTPLPKQTAASEETATPTLEPTPTATVAPTDTPVPPTATLAESASDGAAAAANVSPSPVMQATPTASETASATTEDAQSLRLTPDASQVGWLDSSNAISTWGDSFLYAGQVDGASLISGMRFDLSRISRGAPIYAGSFQMTGLADDRLNPAEGGLWRVQMIAASELSSLEDANFMMLYSAPASVTMKRDLTATELERNKVNTWDLGEFDLAWLEKQILDGATSLIVRVVQVPEGNGTTLFAWDSGLGDRSNGNSPAFNFSIGAAPATPPPLPTREYLVATFTPVPANVLTLVAQQETATQLATSVGTATPVPPFITPTPQAEDLRTLQARAQEQELPAIAVITPTPASSAEATANAEYATAVALTTGTYTPVPADFVTPFVIPPSPPAQNVLTEVARIAEATAAAAEVRETPTPAPHNMLIGEWITATPTAVNAATAAAISVEATRLVEIYGRPTETPFHWLVYTLTPTPMPTSTPTTPPIILASDFTPTPVPTATEFIPATLPDEYKNLIFYKKHTNSGESTWVVDPATGETGLVTRDWIYPMARKSLTLSPNGQEEVFVRTNDQGIAELFIRRLDSTRDRKLTAFTASSYDPAWSPDGQWIAFVSSNSGNDEIYRVSPDGAIVQQLTHNNWEWDKHPSWSPDSSKIVFFSNRDVGRTQIWVMNADGSGQQRLVVSEDEDMYPVWAR